MEIPHRSKSIFPIGRKRKEGTMHPVLDCICSGLLLFAMISFLVGLGQAGRSIDGDGRW
jgi:hypothetical protein